MISSKKSKHICLMIIAIGLLWGALETISFATLYAFDFYYLLPFPVTEPNSALTFADHLRPLLKRKDLRLTSYVISDEDLIWRPRPNFDRRIENVNRRPFPGQEYKYSTVKINSRGFRTPEFVTAKKQGIFRVVSIGDSNVFGWGVEEKDSFCGVLRERLRPLGGEYINLGVPGYTSTQAVTLFRREALGLSPDFLIVWLGENDNHLLVRKPDSELIRFNKSVLGRTQSFCFTHSFVYRLLFKLGADLLRWRGKHLSPTPRVPLEEFENNMNYLAKSCSQNGIMAIFMLHYNPADPYQQVVARVAQQYGYPFVPIRELYRTAAQKELAHSKPPSWDFFEQNIVQQWVIPGDGHPTLRGHLLIADELYSIISAQEQRRTKP